MSASKFFFVWLALLTFSFAYQVHAVAVEVDDLVTTDCATSSNNVELTANTLGYETYLYRADSEDVDNWTWVSGQCDVHNAKNCPARVAPTAGLNPAELYNPTAPVLDYDTWYFVEDSASASCANSGDLEACINASDQYQSFRIVSNIDDCNPAPPAETSTNATSTMTEFETFISYYLIFGTVFAGAVVAYKLLI